MVAILVFEESRSRVDERSRLPKNISGVDDAELFLSKMPSVGRVGVDCAK